MSIHQRQEELFEQESLLWAEAKRGGRRYYPANTPQYWLFEGVNGKRRLTNQKRTGNHAIEYAKGWNTKASNGSHAALQRYYACAGDVEVGIRYIQELLGYHSLKTAE